MVTADRLRSLLANNPFPTLSNLKQITRITIKRHTITTYPSTTTSREQISIHKIHESHASHLLVLSFFLAAQLGHAHPHPSSKPPRGPASFSAHERVVGDTAVPVVRQSKSPSLPFPPPTTEPRLLLQFYFTEIPPR